MKISSSKPKVQNAIPEGIYVSRCVGLEWLMTKGKNAILLKLKWNLRLSEEKGFASLYDFFVFLHPKPIVRDIAERRMSKLIGALGLQDVDIPIPDFDVELTSDELQKIIVSLENKEALIKEVLNQVVKIKVRNIKKTDGLTYSEVSEYFAMNDNVKISQPPASSTESVSFEEDDIPF